MSDLDRIELYAQRAMNDAISLTGAVRILRSRPSFETKAEDAIRLAEAELERSLSAVRSARQEFSKKPVTA